MERRTLWWVAAGLGAGAAAYALMGRGRPRLLLTIRPGVGDLGINWPYYAKAGGYTACVKIANGAGAWLSKSAPMVAAAQAGGLPVWGWGYHYLSRWRWSGSAGDFVIRYGSDLESALAEADAAAEACNNFGAKGYLCNAEKYAFGVWSEPGYGPTPPVTNVAQTVSAFAQRFRERAPAVDLWWNGLTYVSYTDTAGNPRFGLTPDAMAGYDGLMPMLYGSGANTASYRAKRFGKWVKARKKADDLGVDLGAMVGTGHVSPGTGGQAGMYAFDADQAPGLITTVAAMQPAALAFFYGGNSGGMLELGTSVNPSLSRLGPWLRAAYSEGSDFAGTPAHPDWTPGAGGELVA